MKKLSTIIGLFLVLIAGLVYAAPEATLVELSPAIANTTTDFTASMTCEGIGTLTAFWEVEKDSAVVDSGSLVVSTDTKTTLDTIASSLTAKGEEWSIVGWCGNATENSSKVNSNSVTIGNSAPVAISATVLPASATTTSQLTCSGSSSDDDSDSLTESFRFVRGGTQLQAWGTTTTFQCSASSCPVGSTVSCEYRVSDGTATSNVATDGVVIVAPASSLSVGTVNLGGTTQEKSNPDEDEIVTTSSQMTITNTGTNTVSGISLSGSSIAAKFNVSITPSTIATLSPGQSTSFTVKVNVPEDFDSFDADANDPQDDRAFSIGSVTASGSDGTNTISASGTVNLETENKLEIDRLYVIVEDDSERVDDGDTVDKIAPGDKIEVRLIADSRYSSGDDVDMEDITFEIVIDDGDVDEEEEEDISDIDAGDDSEEATVEFTLDDDIDEDTYTMIVTLTGEDSYGAIHGEQWEIRLDVEKEDEEITIKSLVLSPETLSCSRTASLNTRIENTGKDDSDEISLLIKNDALGIFSRTRNIDLNDGDDESKTLSISVGDNVVSGLYTIQVFTYFDDDAYDDDDISQFRTVDLKVEKCGSDTDDSDDDSDSDSDSDSTDTSSGDDDTVVIIDDTDTTTDTTTPAVVARPPVDVRTGMDDNTTLILIILGYVVAIGIGIILLASLFRRR